MIANIASKLGVNALSTPLLHVSPLMPLSGAIGSSAFGLSGIDDLADDADIMELDPEMFGPGDDDPNDEDYDDEAERRPAYRKPTKEQMVRAPAYRIDLSIERIASQPATVVMFRILISSCRWSCAGG